MSTDKATLPPSAPPEVSGRRLLGRKVEVVVNAASVVAGIVAAGIGYTVLAMIVGMGLGAGVLYQSESMRLATGIRPASTDFVPAIGSPASVLLAAITLSVFLGAFACGRVAFRAMRQWLAARLGQEG